MKNPEEVKKAISILKENAETDFEKISVDQLERILNNPPRVKVLDERRQSFKDKIYFKSGNGYYFTNSNLHVEVYKTFFGEIPEGYHVHHLHGDKENNNIENLVLKSREVHAKEHFEEYRDSLQNEQRICKQCGKKFSPRQTNQVYCSKECQIKFFNTHKKNKKIEKKCIICGNLFVTRDRKNFTAVTCSAKCAGKLARIKKTYNKHKA